MSITDANISTEHQPKGAAANPSDTLDRTNEPVTSGQRQWNADSAETPAAAAPTEADADRTQNAGARPGGEAAGGIDPQPGDPATPKGDAEASPGDHFGDDGPRSTYKS